MPTTVIDEVVEKVATWTDEERRELIQLLQEQENKEKSKLNYKPSQNVEWLKKHSKEYTGNYVALKDGELIAFGRTIKDADTKAKEKGFNKTLLHYIPAEDEEVWGGW